ncbi:hypothetical protein [Thioclava pacifica]|uniref:Nucleotide-diphospho-sugar transferase domain-containing protein n=1 Tax=Thioclava pacifica DSM 10166 TaxID=1353537 RepID=A0A074JUA3_9RHOB|nr:hypothetical protein [Thioclava pacifica]KEO52937.1 hypothetical protein TP2_08335 [Thioclava pacifica DSM 10166]
MTVKPLKSQPFNVFCIAQSGRLEYEAILFVLSFRAANPDFAGRLLVAEPQPGSRWSEEVRISGPVRAILEAAGAEIVPFESKVFGQSYPYGNKIEALAALPAGEPFVFFDTDTVFTGALSEVGFDFTKPSASMRRTGTWPEPPLYGPGYTAIWKSLYDKFGLDGFEDTLDLSQPDEYWRRYMYFNAGWFFGADPAEFGARFLRYAREIRDEAPDELACQSLDPWLDQVALPLVIHSFGGGRPGPELDGLDGSVSCHYRALPLLYARESDAAIEMVEAVVAPNPIKKVLKAYEPAKKLIYQGKGRKLRALIAEEGMPRTEKMLRNRIKRAKLWLR